MSRRLVEGCFGLVPFLRERPRLFGHAELDGRLRPRADITTNYRVLMDKLTAVVLDDQSVMLDGRKLAGTDEVAAAIKLLLQSVPHFFLND